MFVIKNDTEEAIKQKYEIDFSFMEKKPSSENIIKKKICVAAIAAKLAELYHAYKKDEMSAEMIAESIGAIAWDLSSFREYLKGYYMQIDVVNKFNVPAVKYDFPHINKTAQDIERGIEERNGNWID